MPSKHAKTLDDATFALLLSKVRQRGNHRVLMLLLSYKAGLRAQEIAGMTWGNVRTPTGDIRNDEIYVPARIAKGKKEARVPMHPLIYAELVVLHSTLKNKPKDDAPMFTGKSCGGCMSANSVTVWFHRLYAECGLEGCSSHSGRRTFITNLARQAGSQQCSLRDVQVLARHADVRTTEKYIDISPNLRRLVGSI